MEDKTAEIPSLKKYDSKRRDRDAQNQRNKTMQTKSQLQRSSDKTEPKTRGKSVSDETRRFSQEDMTRISSGQKGKKSASDNRKPAPKKENLGDTRVFGVQNDSKKAARNGGKKTSASPRAASDKHQGTAPTRRKPADTVAAPKVYARHRNGVGGVSSEKPSVSQSTRRMPPVREDDVTLREVPTPQKHRIDLRNFLRYFAIGAVVVIVGVILSLTVLFKTQTITVSGHGTYSAQEIIQASGLKKGDNIFLAPKSKAEENILKAFPYMESVDVYCVFPDGINIDVTPANPACVFEADGLYCVVSNKGKVLEVTSTTDELGVPVIEGLDAQAKTPGEYVSFGSDVIGTALEEMFAAFKEYSVKNVTSIEVMNTDDGKIELRYVYDNRIVVYLGLPEHINYKVQTAHVIITEKLDVSESTNIAGDLDVSMCYDSKKSYFKQYTILAENEAPPETEPETTAPESAVDDYYTDDWYGDDSSDYDDVYTDDSYYDDSYSDDSYYDDGYYDDSYADDGYYDDSYADDGGSDDSYGSDDSQWDSDSGSDDTVYY
ncbi:MAG: FtsQ-type POTRA domain-containing protein [Ruminococcus sp.]|nr:FtsQ-type POTRA domain-containing protein [Ruminococcus sp.]